MNPQSLSTRSAVWAHFRFAIVGSLLSAPPSRGELQAAIAVLAEKTWTHPITQREVHFSAKTIERWFYRARRERDDPVGVLRRAVRKDCGKVSLTPELVQLKAIEKWDGQLPTALGSQTVFGLPTK